MCLYGPIWACTAHINITLWVACRECIHPSSLYKISEILGAITSLCYSNMWSISSSVFDCQWELLWIYSGIRGFPVTMKYVSSNLYLQLEVQHYSHSTWLWVRGYQELTYIGMPHQLWETFQLLWNGCTASQYRRAAWSQVALGWWECHSTGVGWDLLRINVNREQVMFDWFSGWIWLNFNAWSEH